MCLDCIDASGVLLQGIKGGMSRDSGGIAETGADELMIVSDVYDHASRLRSLELIA